MNAIFRLAAFWLLVPLAIAATLPRVFQPASFTRRDLEVSVVESELGEVLSEGSLIFGPESINWNNATSRWSLHALPVIEIVVQPALESDVSTIVKYCNENSIEFLPYAHGNGFTQSLAKFKGLQLDLSQLNKITIQPDGKSAWFQGAVRNREAIDTLWKQGYVATTGSSACIGLLGAGLGGGHGRLEGFYGMVSDNFITLNVVLADGRRVQVSKNSNSDLFWAMKGAGHNFGIVTSVELKIYPQGHKLWHYHNYVWSQDKFEVVLQKLNKFHNNGNTPKLMAVNFGQVAVDPAFDKVEPVLSWTFAYRGPAKDAEKLLKPFNEIEALWDQSGDVPYPEILALQGNDVTSDSCQSAPFTGSAAGLLAYNVTVERKILDLYRQKLVQFPQMALGSRLYYEGYSMAAVKAIDSASSAFPMRQDNHLVFFITVVWPDIANELQQLGEVIRTLWNSGAHPNHKPTTYTNYALGTEPLEWMYGHEPWRLTRLRQLKAKYDPQNRFKFFNPIIKA